MPFWGSTRQYGKPSREPVDAVHGFGQFRRTPIDTAALLSSGRYVVFLPVHKPGTGPVHKSSMRPVHSGHGLVYDPSVNLRPTSQPKNHWRNMVKASQWKVSPQQKEFLRPYLGAYRQVKKNARTKPRDYAQFQSQLWLLWRDRFQSELLPPDLLDIDAVNHWYACRQEDLALIVRTLKFWEPFYTVGRERVALNEQKMKRQMKEHGPNAEGGDGDSIQRSGRVPKPRKFPDHEL
ncbi:uncharacterized protein EV420DRAFT_1487428 [Desarmillaria tabescens]|uniref:Uncharacterized protein n=1 Tax=Armillaria tabescens TaxID=1929756 RepID=A0AA39J7J5_ARMTA|nr:uncharacterized protein EV420DRAFT_1487428 [Desarmillaria tabescens]KAK0436812.1 hypothetical protein EV420DRAFT_1487428 [Desarmillaria tabescens]